MGGRSVIFRKAPFRIKNGPFLHSKGIILDESRSFPFGELIVLRKRGRSVSG